MWAKIKVKNPWGWNNLKGTPTLLGGLYPETLPGPQDVVLQSSPGLYPLWG